MRLCAPSHSYIGYVPVCDSDIVLLNVPVENPLVESKVSNRLIIFINKMYLGPYRQQNPNQLLLLFVPKTDCEIDVYVPIPPSLVLLHDLLISSPGAVKNPHWHDCQCPAKSFI